MREWEARQLKRSIAANISSVNEGSEEPQNGITERWQGRQSNFVSPLNRRVCDGLFQKAERSRVHTCKKYSGSRESYVTARHKRERSTRGSFGLLSKVLI